MKIRKISDGNASLRFSNSVKYLVQLIAVFLLLGSLTHVHWYFTNSKNPARMLISPIGKLEHLMKLGESYDLIIWGDSRTYLGVDPDVVSFHTGLKAFNYGSMAHWFSTQYSQLKRMIPYLKDKKVVWIIGRINLNVLDSNNPDVNQNFYLDINDFFEYWHMGYSPNVLIDNLMLRYLPSKSILFRKDALQDRLSGFLDKSVFNSNPSGTKNTELIAEQKIIDTAIANVKNIYPDAISSDLAHGKNETNVLVDIILQNGQRPQYEVKPDYFRSLQKQWAAEISSTGDYTVNPIMLRLLNKILALFRDNKIELIVVEYRDAPYQTTSTSVHNSHRSILDMIQNIVLSSGHTYLKPDMSSLYDSDYFDYNHLNSIGAQKYSTILGTALAHHLR